MREHPASATSSRWSIVMIVLTVGIGVELCLLGMHLLPRCSQPVQAIAHPPATQPPPTVASPKPLPTPSSQRATPAPEPIGAPTARVASAGQAIGLPPTRPVKWTVGYSVRGKAITGFRFGDGADTTFILGAFHGNEPGSHAVCMELVRYLEANPALYSDRMVIIVPACNPDGLAADTRVNANGVDINRNWSYGWEKAGRGEWSHGDSPMSEPEVRAVAGLLEKYLPTKVINLHQAMNMLNPTGVGGIALAQEMARYNSLEVDTSIGYPTPGSFGNYCGKHLGIAMVTYELPGGTNPWPSAKEALLAAIKFRVP